MSKVAVVYWSGTGNTEAMAEAVAEGARAAGADVSVFGSGSYDSLDVTGFDGLAFGCPAMGAEALIVNDAPDEEALESCKALGAAIV